MKGSKFDVEALYAALDQTRQERALTWRGVSQETGVSASTLTRMAQGSRPDLDGLASLATWSGLDVNAFVRNDDIQRGPSTLAKVTALFRSDPTLTSEAAAQLEGLVKSAYRLATLSKAG